MDPLPVEVSMGSLAPPAASGQGQDQGRAVRGSSETWVRKRNSAPSAVEFLASMAVEEFGFSGQPCGVSGIASPVLLV